MAEAKKGVARRRGSIDRLPSGALRVRVYAGIDPVSKRHHYLTEIIDPGPQADALAEKARTKLLNQVDERRNPRTKATVVQLLERHLKMVDVAPTTRIDQLARDNHVSVGTANRAVALLKTWNLVQVTTGGGRTVVRGSAS